MPKREYEESKDGIKDINDSMDDLFGAVPSTSKSARAESEGFITPVKVEKCGGAGNGDLRSFEDTVVTPYLILSSEDDKFQNITSSDDELINEEDGTEAESIQCDTKQEYPPGTASPSSSNGSACVEFLYRNIESMQRNGQLLRSEMTKEPNISLSQEAHDLFSEFIKTPAFRERFQNFMIHDARSHFCSTGRSLESNVVEELLTYLGSNSDPSLLARIGKVFLQDYLEDQNCGLGGCDMKNYPTQDNPLEQTLVKFDIVDTINPSIPSTSGDVVDSITMENGNNDGEPPSVPAFQAQNNYTCAVVCLPSSKWEEAFDHIREKDKVEKIAKVLFLAVFTPQEIQGCCRRPNKKQANMRSFDKDKVRFLKCGVKWLLSGPPSRTQAAFEEHMATGGSQLSDEEDTSINQKVLTEYAYQQRTKLNKQSK